LLSLSAQPSSSTFYPSSCLGNATSLAQQNTDLKIEFQSPFWGPVSDQAKSFIRRLSALDLLHRPTAHDVYATLGLLLPPPPPPPPPLPPRHHPTLITKWHNTLTGIRTANKLSFFSDTSSVSRLSMQSSGGWNDQDPSPRIVAQAALKEEEQEKGDLGRDDTMPGSFEPAYQEPSLPWTEISDASSCKVKDPITLLKFN